MVEGMSPLVAIARITRALVANDEEHYALRLIADEASLLMRSRLSVVALRDGAGDYHLRASSGLDAEAKRSLYNRPLSGSGFAVLRAAASHDGEAGVIGCDHAVHDDPAVADFLASIAAAAGTTSSLFAPFLCADGPPLGFLITSLQSPAVDDDLLHATAVLADLAVFVIQTATARAGERTRAYVADALLRAAASVRDSLQLDEVLVGAANAMTAVSGFRRVSINLIDAQNCLDVRATSGLTPDEEAHLRSTRLPLVELAPFMRPEMRVSRSFLFDHRYYEVPPSLLAQVSIPAGSVAVDGRWHPLDSLTVPLLGPDGETIGTISADEPWNGVFPDLSHIQALEFFADQAATAILQARQYEAVAHQASTDPLTGVANRQAFVHALHGAAGTASKGTQCALLFCDVDRFKAVNDTFGHLAGDRALIAVAHALAGGLRPNDLLARYGGDEFVVLLRDVGAEEAIATAERLRARVAALHAPALPEGVTTLRISIGVTVHMADGVTDDTEALMHSADQALYDAKTGGRDCIRVR
jgi:diguanylate cyclase (GGDEF)-like protein